MGAPGTRFGGGGMLHEHMQRHVLHESSWPHARCLDGSRAAYYVRLALAHSSAPRSWVIQLGGGGQCWDKDSCQEAKKTYFGSSAAWSQTYDGNTFVSPNRTLSPFADWNHAFVPQCGSDQHLGTAGYVHEWDAVFSGRHIVDAVIGDLSAQYGLQKADALLFAGSSGGGIAVNNLADSVQEMVPAAKLVALPVAANHFLPMPRSDIYHGPGKLELSNKELVDKHNIGRMHLIKNFSLPAACLQAHPSTPSVCYFLKFALRHMKADAFMVLAQVDKTYLSMHGGFQSPCMQLPLTAETGSFARQWARKTSLALEPLRRPQSGGRRMGLFFPACWLHSEFDFAGPLVHGRNLVSAAYEWLFHNGTRVYEDDCGGNVMCNPTCLDAYGMKRANELSYQYAVPTGHEDELLDRMVDPHLQRGDDGANSTKNKGSGSAIVERAPMRRALVPEIS